MSICWLVDKLLSERAYETGYPSLAEAAYGQGHRVYETKYVPFSKKPDSLIEMLEMTKEGSCVVTHGTIEFCRQIEKHYGRWWTPGMYFNQNVKSFSRYAPFIDDLLNSEYYILPYAEVVRRARAKGSQCFIKPESGMKEFVGQVISAETLDDDLKKLSPYHAIEPETLCIIAEPKDIKAEFRYVICHKKVVTGSEYRWGNVLDVRRDTHPIADAMAKKVAEADWQADTVYVCDVALIDFYGDNSDFVAKVIELNAFSSSGLYACDTNKIVEAVSKAAEREWQGELEDA